MLCQKKYTFSDTKVLDNVYYILYNKVDKNRNYIKFITVVYKNKHIWNCQKKYTFTDTFRQKANRIAGSEAKKLTLWYQNL